MAVMHTRFHEVEQCGGEWYASRLMAITVTAADRRWHGRPPHPVPGFGSVRTQEHCSCRESTVGDESAAGGGHHECVHVNPVVLTGDGGGHWRRCGGTS